MDVVISMAATVESAAFVDALDAVVGYKIGTTSLRKHAWMHHMKKAGLQGQPRNLELASSTRPVS